MTLTTVNYRFHPYWRTIQEASNLYKQLRDKRECILKQLTYVYHYNFN